MDRWDTIVIGSGIGGLVAAVALARQGQRVLVLEQHYLPGGWTQSFSLSGHRFSPGVHYVGECGPGGSLRNLFEGLGVGHDLEFCEMNPDGFDHLLIAGDRFDIPKGKDRLVARLVRQFPEEQAGLLRYFDTCSRLSTELAAVDTLLEFPKALLLPFKAPNLIRWGLRTQSALLDATVKNPRLAAILAAQNGDHGLAPSRVSLPAHAAMIAHYYAGAFYPRGGAKRLPSALLKALRARGGKVRLRARVSEIIVERGRVAGVALENGERIFASAVVSNADPHVTYNRLLAREHAPKERKKSRKMRYSAPILSVFAAVELDLRARGFDSGNYWFYRDVHVGRAYERIEDAMPGPKVDALFLAIPTLKDPGSARPGLHTLEMFTFLPYDPFRAFEGTRPGERGASYEQLKEALGDQMIAAAEHVIPGLSKAIVFRAVGTPVTNSFYCASPFGCSYGTRKTPFQLGPFSYRSVAEVDGLFLCGASTLSHGVAGAAISGLLAAQKVLQMKHWRELLGPPDGSIRVYPAEHPETWLAEKRDPKDELEEVSG